MSAVEGVSDVAQVLAGRHALVTAAVGPLGRALAVAFAEAGAHVSVTTLHDDRAEEVRANSILNECWSAGSQGQAKTIDLADPVAVEAAIDALEREVGPIDILVNAAHDEDVAAVSVVTQAVGRRMRARGSGRVINVVPAMMEDGLADGAASDASQDSVLGFTRSLAAEWERGGTGVKDRITVNALGVGGDDDAIESPLDATTRADLREKLLYLALPASSAVHGQLLVVGGTLADRA